ncbi:MAG: tyrosine-type recombinase/integrase, partial [Pelosinus sp.]|nr:tyrosine-type recombinase/integrase [Pelosinus sp.]
DAKTFIHHHLKVLLQAPQTINVKRTAIKFFYVNILDIHWDDNKICNVKPRKTIPVVLSMDEVASIINAIDNLTYKTIAILMYSAGLRVSEVIKLKISDIDSKNMQLLITDAKGNKDRYAILSEKCLQTLRTYYKLYKPTNYLFEGQHFNPHISKESVEGAITVAAIKSGINKKVTPHTLRHAFATHLLELDTNLYYIKQLLGHSSIRSSARYMHTVSFSNMNVKSPLDFNGGFQ